MKNFIFCVVDYGKCRLVELIQDYFADFLIVLSFAFTIANVLVFLCFSSLFPRNFSEYRFMLLSDNFLIQYN